MRTEHSKEKPFRNNHANNDFVSSNRKERRKRKQPNSQKKLSTFVGTNAPDKYFHGEFRNKPCKCGSGLKYKKCCGKIGGNNA